MNLTPSNDANIEDRLLICDCDGVLIDSEAVAARMLVSELQALWPGVDVEPVVMPLLGLRIEAARAMRIDLLRCLVVEDSATRGDGGARGGQPVLGFIGGGHATEGQIGALQRADAHAVFDDMTRLPALVEQWLQNATFEIR